MTKAFRPDVDAPEWKGGYSPYDIVKEGIIAVVIVSILTVLLSVAFGSPDDPSITVKAWSTNAPMDFATTALSKLNGTSGSAGYGPPYNNASTGQQLGPLTLAKWVGDRIPVNTVNDFIIDPLKSLPKQPALTADLSQWSSASGSARAGWVKNYSQAAKKMQITSGQLVVNATNAGPLPVMMADLFQMARTGALDQAQVTPMNSSGNGDILVWGIMMVLSAGLLLTPFIPGLRSIPRKTRVYRLIWREHYRSLP